MRKPAGLWSFLASLVLLLAVTDLLLAAEGVVEEGAMVYGTFSLLTIKARCVDINNEVLHMLT